MHHWWSPEALERVSPEEGRRRGKRSEDRVSAAFRSVGTEDVPNWYVALRKATPSEDRRGIDFVVYASDGGEYLLQVKSSLPGKWEFLFRGLSIPASARLNIDVVVVRPNDTLVRIREKVFEALRRTREESIHKQEA